MILQMEPAARRAAPSRAPLTTPDWRLLSRVRQRTEKADSSPSAETLVCGAITVAVSAVKPHQLKHGPANPEEASAAVARLLAELQRLDGATDRLSTNHVLSLHKAANGLATIRLHHERQRIAVAAATEPDAIHELSEAAFRRHRLALLRRDPHCAYCRCVVTPKSATLDHVVPRSRGGANKPANLVLTCGTCNKAKANQTPQEWAAAILSVAERAKGGAA